MVTRISIRIRRIGFHVQGKTTLLYYTAVCNLKQLHWNIFIDYTVLRKSEFVSLPADATRLIFTILRRRIIPQSRIRLNSPDFLG